MAGRSTDHLVGDALNAAHGPLERHTPSEWEQIVLFETPTFLFSLQVQCKS